jgi:drug/metabolite transporter superfamily protein YnfA
MGESMRRITLILLALILTLLMPLMVGRVNAADAWILWKQRTEVQPNGEIETHWFVQTALTEYSMCYAMALRLAEADRKILNAGGKLTVVRIGDKEGEGVTIFYRCFPDTFDPRK